MSTVALPLRVRQVLRDFQVQSSQSQARQLENTGDLSHRGAGELLGESHPVNHRERSLLVSKPASSRLFTATRTFEVVLQDSVLCYPLSSRAREPIQNRSPFSRLLLKPHPAVSRVKLRIIRAEWRTGQRRSMATNPSTFFALFLIKTFDSRGSDEIERPPNYFFARVLERDVGMLKLLQGTGLCISRLYIGWPGIL